MPRTPTPAALGAYVIVDDADDPGAFSFAPRVPPSEIPAAQTKVIAAATAHYTNILAYIEGASEQNQWLSNLKKSVSLGAVQAEADPATALEQIKRSDQLLADKLAEFLRPARNRLLLVTGVIFAVAIAVGFFGSASGVSASYAFAVAASMPGLIIQYLVAIKNVTPKTFRELKSDLSSPMVDTLGCAIMCVIVVVLLASGAVAVNIKGMETKDVETSVRTAVVVGIICGLTSRRLGPSLLGIGAKFSLHRN